VDFNDVTIMILARFLPKIAPKPGAMIGHAFSINVSPLRGLAAMFV